MEKFGKDNKEEKRIKRKHEIGEKRGKGEESGG